MIQKRSYQFVELAITQMTKLSKKARHALAVVTSASIKNCRNLTYLYLNDSGFALEDGQMIFQSLAGIAFKSHIKNLDLFSNPAWFSDEASIESLCQFLA